MTANGVRVIVIGAGIGGLSAANALIAAGARVEVFEQAPALGEVGAGVFLAPNGVRQLQRWGLGPAVEAAGSRLGEGSQYHRHDGATVAPILTTDSRGWNAVYGMHRADMIEILSSGLPDGVVHTGHRAVSFGQDASGATVTFASGESATADVVVAADGIHSALRGHVAPPSTPTPSGSMAYRGLVPAGLVPEWPLGTSHLWMGQRKHFLVYTVRSGSLVNYVGFVPTDSELRESWSAPGDPDVLREEFAGWDPRVEELLSHVTSTFRWGLYDREPLARWTTGRLALMGDAAHPMLPHLGQGANQSIEDAAALATVLGGVTARTAPEALTAYERLRLPRTSAVQRGARDNGLRYDSDYDDLGKRDAEIAASTQFRTWIYDYDVVADAERALLPADQRSDG